MNTSVSMRSLDAARCTAGRASSRAATAAATLIFRSLDNQLQSSISFGLLNTMRVQWLMDCELSVIARP